MREINAAEDALDQRVIDARHALGEALIARDQNHSVETAAAVAIARQHFDDAMRARARTDVVFA
ncbi:hypothetical protein [Methylobacterium gnaphalii]|nr:hypothetical protein [Methylobacterium gnaphalii]